MLIDLTKVQAILAHNNLSLHKGDAVLIRTSWFVHWQSTKTYLGEDIGSRGIAVEVAELLAEQGVAIVRGKTAVVEHHPHGGGSLPVHQKLLAESCVHLLENMQNRRARRCHALPLPVSSPSDKSGFRIARAAHRREGLDSSI